MKNIIICCDGTCSEYGERNTNVVRLCERIDRASAEQQQLLFYDPGVGTFSFLGRNLGRRLGKALGALLGKGLQTNIEEAYKFLMDNYQPGDKVFLFGYSRGAWTVRALAGMLHKVGLLEKGSNNLVMYASKIYNKPSNERNDAIARGFKEAFSRECKPHFIGVWDTVESVGWGLFLPYFGWAIGRRKFYNKRLNGDVANGYHAVSVDEKRSHFQECLWDEDAIPAGQTIKQVWFPGYHGDVGGQGAGSEIPDINLTWMLRQAERKGLVLKRNWGDSLQPDPTGKINQSWSGFWWLTIPRRRRIPEHSQLHSSVLARKRSLESNYHPPNLPDDYVEAEPTLPE